MGKFVYCKAKPDNITISVYRSYCVLDITSTTNYLIIHRVSKYRVTLTIDGTTILP